MTRGEAIAILLENAEIAIHNQEAIRGAVTRDNAGKIHSDLHRLQDLIRSSADDLERVADRLHALHTVIGEAAQASGPDQ